MSTEQRDRIKQFIGKFIAVVVLEKLKDKPQFDFSDVKNNLKQNK